jgi:hypothetical protein
MMWRPALRFAIGPFPPLRLDERFLAATILAPRVLLAMFSPLIQDILTYRSPYVPHDTTFVATSMSNTSTIPAECAASDA